MSAVRGAIKPAGLGDRLDGIDSASIQGELDARGWCVLPGLLADRDCHAIAALYEEDERFRNTVVMARHGFGSGEYRYFDYPLPDAIQTLRARLYPALARIASAWNELLGLNDRFPEDHRDFLALCHGNGQSRPTPLILKYGPGDYNCLHQDLYGDVVFPLQLTILLSKPGEDFTGGEFVLTEQRPRMQSRVHVVPLAQGDAVVFAVRYRPRRGKRGYHRVTLRHGVSTVRSGRRLAAGIIFHDAG